ncbi:hypothetical protein COP1_011450 [Malus domestica]
MVRTPGASPHTCRYNPRVYQRRRNSISATAEPVSFFHPCLIATWTCRHTRSGCRSGVSVLQDPTRIGSVRVRDLQPGISERNKISEEQNSLPIERWRV